MTFFVYLDTDSWNTSSRKEKGDFSSFILNLIKFLLKLGKLRYNLEDNKFRLLNERNDAFRFYPDTTSEISSRRIIFNHLLRLFTDLS